jgi:hypothetical protein
MPSLRESVREVRLLSAIGQFQDHDQTATLDALLAIDFLIHHPLALRRFVEDSKQEWPDRALPSDSELASTEEDLLAWKRASVASVVVPALRNLVARQLLRRGSGNDLYLTTQGSDLLDHMEVQLRQSAIVDSFVREPARSMEWFNDATESRRER